MFLPPWPQDVVVGKIYFLLVRIKLKHMEVEIRRRETTGGMWNSEAAGLIVHHTYILL